MDGTVAKIKKDYCGTKFWHRRSIVCSREAEIVHSESTDGSPGGVLCSGCSGMIGAALRASVGQRGARVVQLVRRAPQRAGEIEWDPARGAVPGPSRIDAVLPIEGLDAAVHLSGVSLADRRWTPEVKKEIEASRVGSTKVLAALLAGLKRPPKVLLVASATGFYGDRGDEVLSEASGAGAGFLPEICAKWEAATQAAEVAGIRVVHLRFGVVIGPGGALKKMLPVFRLGFGGRLGWGRHGGQQWMSWIGLRDAVRAILFAIKTESLSGPVNIVAPHPVTNAEFTRALGRAVHRPAVLPVPAAALRLMFGEMADEALLASTRAVPGKLVKTGFRFEQETISEALAAVGSRR